MKHISSHITGPTSESASPGMPRDARKKEKLTERGELMEYFRTQLNISRRMDKIPLLSMPRMGKILEAIPTKDLYYLKSVCDQSKNFSKKFWWEVNPKKHTPEALAESSAKNFKKNTDTSEEGVYY